MSIIQPNKNVITFYYPDSNYSVAKYLDLTKFISLLQKRALFFCRVDKLEDKFEGELALKNHALKTEMYRSLRKHGIEIEEEKIVKNVLSDIEFTRHHRRIICVSCWNKFDEESAALWKIYSDYNKGIMIKSSINQLTKSLKKQPKEIQLSEVKYINYQKDVIPNHINFPFFHKQKAFSYENEIRMLHQVVGTGLFQDWAKEEVEEGLFVEVDLDDLIDEIILSPGSPTWFHKLVEDVAKKYGLNKNIRQSILS